MNSKLILIILSFLLASIKIYSQDIGEITTDSIFKLSIYEMMNIKVVTATGDLENINTAPATIHAITAKQIEEKGYQNLLDLLKDQPAFDFDIQHGGWVSQVTYLRGTRSNSILIFLFLI